MQSAPLLLSILAYAAMLQAQTSTWQIRESTQAETGIYLGNTNIPVEASRPGFYAVTQQGQMRVEAVCSSDELTYQISSLSHQAIRVDAVSTAGVQRAMITMSLDNRPRQIFGTLESASAISIQFSNKTQTGVGQIEKVTPSGRATGDALSGAEMGAFLQGVFNIIDGMAGHLFFAGTLNEAYTARSIRIPVPLADGTAPVVEIQPQEASFIAFRERCLGHNAPRAVDTQSAPPTGPISVSSSATPEQGAAVPPPSTTTAPIRPRPDRSAYYRSIIAANKDITLGDYMNDGRIYYIHLLDGKPTTIAEYDKATNRTSITSYATPQPLVITGDSNSQKRADAVLKKYLAAHPDIAK